MKGTEFNELFPEEKLLEAFSEWNAWTPISDIQIAAKIIEGRELPADSYLQNIILTYPDSDICEFLLTHCLKWLFETYRCPMPKVLIAMSDDPAIKSDTKLSLEEARFRPNDDEGKPESLRMYFPEVPEHLRLRFFLIEDRPHVLSLVSKPLKALRIMAVSYFEDAFELAKIRRLEKERTGGQPTFFHKHHTDGRLPATIEALAYYLCGHLVGYDPLHGGPNIEFGYRHTALVGMPPFDERHLRIAEETQVQQLESLKNGI